VVADKLSANEPLKGQKATRFEVAISFELL